MFPAEWAFREFNPKKRRREATPEGEAADEEREAKHGRVDTGEKGVSGDEGVVGRAQAEAMEEDEGVSEGGREAVHQCWACAAVRPTLALLERHYVEAHAHQCATCGLSLPTAALLEMHVAEAHDAYTQARAFRGDRVFECLVDGCMKTFRSDLDRKRHLCGVHRFPKTFRFHFKVPAWFRELALETVKGSGAPAGAEPMAMETEGGPPPSHSSGSVSFGGRGRGRGRGRGFRI
mmetsp:Transcript_6950/g.23084  ORF Transcript_6950/g.23084 Transcript_6950/m.23084 type:complete len:234 (-) Transcript_6950:947-1648(-)